jgi:hypothetical protein
MNLTDLYNLTFAAAQASNEPLTRENVEACQVLADVLLEHGLISPHVPNAVGVTAATTDGVPNPWRATVFSTTDDEEMSRRQSIRGNELAARRWARQQFALLWKACVSPRNPRDLRGSIELFDEHGVTIAKLEASFQVRSLAYPDRKDLVLDLVWAEDLVVEKTQSIFMVAFRINDCDFDVTSRRPASEVMSNTTPTAFSVVRFDSRTLTGTTTLGDLIAVRASMPSTEMP